MAKRNKAYESKPNDKKIEVNVKQISPLFQNVPAEKERFTDGLIYQLAVTIVLLERLVKELNEGEVIEDFVQGSQRLRRENPALRSYNTTIKSFATLSKSLLDLLPEKTQKQAGEELMNFALTPPRGD